MSIVTVCILYLITCMYRKLQARQNWKFFAYFVDLCLRKFFTFYRKNLNFFIKSVFFFNIPKIFVFGDAVYYSFTGKRLQKYFKF